MLPLNLEEDYYYICTAMKEQGGNNRELTTNVCRKQPFCTYTQHGLFSTKLLVLSKQTFFDVVFLN